MTQKELKVSRVKDREAMAAILSVIALDCDADVSRCDVLSDGNAIHLRIKAARGLNVGIGLDGSDRQDQAGTFCMPWCIWDTEAKLSEAFGRAMQSSVNPHHRRKCTAFSSSWRDLTEKLRAGLTMAADGSAFNAE